MCGVILALVTLLLAGCSGKDASEQALPSPLAILSVGAIPDVSLTHGETASVAVPITVLDGYHVQANPASGEFLIPLELQLDPVEELTFGAPEYPNGTPYRLENTDDVLQTYGGTFAVNISITALKAGALDIKGTVRYQACDSKRCFFPASVPLAFKVIVEEKTNKGAGS